MLAQLGEGEKFLYWQADMFKKSSCITWSISTALSGPSRCTARSGEREGLPRIEARGSASASRQTSQ
jgi:hypothetical protein